MQDPSCIFCKIVSGEIPTRIIMQNERAIGLLDAFPLAAGHALVVPKSHYSKIQDMDKEDAAAVFEILWKISGAVERAARVEASTVAVHNGREAGQEIPHMHVHVVPRKSGDGAGTIHSMFKSRPKLDAAEMDQMLDKIKSML